MAKEKVRIETTRVGDEVFVSKTDVLVLLAKTMNESTPECKTTLKNLMDKIADPKVMG